MWSTMRYNKETRKWCCDTDENFESNLEIGNGNSKYVTMGVWNVVVISALYHSILWPFHNKHVL